MQGQHHLDGPPLPDYRGLAGTQTTAFITFSLNLFLYRAFNFKPKASIASIQTMVWDILECQNVKLYSLFHTILFLMLDIYINIRYRNKFLLLIYSDLQ